MRISDWSSDVCSTDLRIGRQRLQFPHPEIAVQLIVEIHAATVSGKPQSIAQRPFSSRKALACEKCLHPRKPLCAEKIGRASCRESGCQYVYISVVAVSLKTKPKIYSHYYTSIQ